MIYEVLWGLITVIVVASWAFMLRNWRSFVSKPKEPSLSSPKVVFLIASRNCPPFIQKSVDSIRESCREVGFSNYEVILALDSEGSPITGAKKIIVPQDYVCKSKYKARALNYTL